MTGGIYSSWPDKWNPLIDPVPVKERVTAFLLVFLVSIPTTIVVIPTEVTEMFALRS